MRKQIVKYRRILLLLCAASFYFLSVDIIADIVLAERLAPNAFIPVRILYLWAMMLGFLTWSGLKKIALRMKSLMPAAIPAAAALFGMAVIKQKSLMTVCVILSLYAAGLLGAACYEIAASDLQESPYIGRLCAFGMGLAAIIQVIVSLLPLALPVYAAILCAAMLLSLYLIQEVFWNGDPLKNAGPQEDGRIENTAVRTDHEGWNLPSVWMLAAGIALISVMGGLNDGELSALQATGAMNLYAVPRLFYFVGMALAGWTADKYRLKGLSLMVLVVMICSTGGALFMTMAGMIYLNASLYSLFAGIVIIYFTVPFFISAGPEGSVLYVSHTDAPAGPALLDARYLSLQKGSSHDAALWPSLGRAIRLPALATGTAIYEYILKGMPLMDTAISYVVLSALLTVLFALSGQLNTPVQTQPAAPEKTEDDGSRVLRFAEKYGLTQRETEVFQALVMSQAEQKDIAQDLAISLRTLQAHVTSIYRKTGAKNRAGLYHLFKEL